LSLFYREGLFSKKIMWYIENTFGIIEMCQAAEEVRKMSDGAGPAASGLSEYIRLLWISLSG